MDKQSLNIVIFEGSFQTTAFIRRLIEGLAQTNAVYILGFNESNPHPVKGVTYLPLGDNQNKFRFLWVSLGLAWRSCSPSGFFSTVKDLFLGSRKTIQQRNLEWQLERIQPDIIHVQWPSLIPWFEADLKAQKYHFVLSNRGFHINVRPFVNAENRAYLAEYLPYFKGLHSVSKSIENEIHQISTMPQTQKKVVYTGIDLNDFPFRNNYTREAVLKIVAVGRPHWIKGYSEAIKSMAILKEQGVDFHFTIVGGSGDEELLYIMKDLKLTEEITLTGALPFEEVQDRIRTSNLMLISSLAEGIPNVAVEAMAQGIPVISTQCGGIEELITPNEMGWLVPTYDAEAMAEAILHFVALEDEVIEQVRLEARKKVEAQHSMEQMVQGMEELYSLVVSRES